MPCSVLKGFTACVSIAILVSQVHAQDIVSSHPFSVEELTALAQVAEQGGSPAILADTTLQADFDNGSTIYDNACAACHGETGLGGQDGGPALTGNLSLSQTMLVIHDGRNTMPAFDVFTEQQLVDISTFVVERMNQ